MHELSRIPSAAVVGHWRAEVGCRAYLPRELAASRPWAWPPAPSLMFVSISSGSDRERLFSIQQPVMRKNISLREDFERVWDAMSEVQSLGLARQEAEASRAAHSLDHAPVLFFSILAGQRLEPSHAAVPIHAAPGAPTRSHPGQRFQLEGVYGFIPHVSQDTPKTPSTTKSASLPPLQSRSHGSGKHKSIVIRRTADATVPAKVRCCSKRKQDTAPSCPLTLLPAAH